METEEKGIKVVIRYKTGFVMTHYGISRKLLEKEKKDPQFLSCDELKDGEETRDVLESRRGSIEFMTSSGKKVTWTPDDIREIEMDAILHR